MNLLGLTAGLAAYRDGQGWLDELMVYLEGNRDFLMNFLQEQMPEIKMTPVEGTYLAWLDCRVAGSGESTSGILPETRADRFKSGRDVWKRRRGLCPIEFRLPQKPAGGRVEADGE